MLEENNVGANSQPKSSAPQPAAPTAGAGTLVQLPAGSAALVEEENMAADSQPESSAPQPAATTAGAGTLVQRLRQELAHCERAHVDRLQGYQERLAVLATAPRRRGRARQQQHRELERGLRPRRTDRAVAGISPAPASADTAALLPAALAAPGQRLGDRLRRTVLAGRALVAAAD